LKKVHPKIEAGPPGRKREIEGLKSKYWKKLPVCKKKREVQKKKKNL